MFGPGRGGASQSAFDVKSLHAKIWELFWTDAIVRRVRRPPCECCPRPFGILWLPAMPRGRRVRFGPLGESFGALVWLVMNQSRRRTPTHAHEAANRRFDTLQRTRASSGRIDGNRPISNLRKQLSQSLSRSGTVSSDRTRFITGCDAHRGAAWRQPAGLSSRRWKKAAMSR